MTNSKRILLDTNGEITINQQWLPSPQRKHDKFLMPTFYKFIPDKQSLIQLNNCRLYLQFFSISYLESVDGTKLLKHPLNGICLLHCHSALTRPHQKTTQERNMEIFLTSFQKNILQTQYLYTKKTTGKVEAHYLKTNNLDRLLWQIQQKTIQIHTKSIQFMDLPSASRCKSIHL